MADSLFECLLAAQTSEEEMQLLLAALPTALCRMAWVAAIPHWFNADVLAVLLPDLSSQAAGLYAQLQSLAFVEPYQGRGHNVHELTREIILTLWWNTRRDEYRQISGRAETYFAAQDDDGAHVEAAYHSIVASPFDLTGLTGRWNETAASLRIPEQFSLAHTLIQNAREHIAAGRVPDGMVRLVSGWERTFAGELETLAEERRKAQDLTAAVEILGHARLLYADLGDQQAEANVLVKLNTTYQMYKRPDVARDGQSPSIF